MAKEGKKPAMAKKTEHHTGKGTRARLNTAAERLFFGGRSN